MTDVDVAQEAGKDFPPGRDHLGDRIKTEPHRALSRRQRIQAIDHFYKPVPVARGTQQATAMESIRETARVLAVTIEERCPEGVQKEHALRAAAEAMFWGNQSVSHR